MRSAVGCFDMPEPPLEPPEYPEESWPRCPICGAECDTYYRDREGETVGCGECIRAVDAWEEAAYG